MKNMINSKTQQTGQQFNNRSISKQKMEYQEENLIIDSTNNNNLDYQKVIESYAIDIDIDNNNNLKKEENIYGYKDEQEKCITSISDKEQSIEKILQILKKKNSLQKSLEPDDVQILLKETEKIPFFAHMNKKELYRMHNIHESCVNMLSYQKFRRGHIIFHRDEIPTDAYILLKGRVNIYTPKNLEIINQEILSAEKFKEESIINFGSKRSHLYDKDKIPNYVYVPPVYNNNSLKNDNNNIVYKLDETSSNSSSGLSIDGDHVYEVIIDNQSIKTESSTSSLNDYDNNAIPSFEKKLKILTDMLGGIPIYAINQSHKLFTDRILNVIYKVKIQPGRIFGLAGLLKGKPRKYTAICYEDCEIAILNRLDYQKICLEMINKRRRERINFIWNKIFPDMPRDIAANMSEMMDKFKFGKGHKIYKESDKPDGFYILKHGEIQFVQKKRIKEEKDYIDEATNDLYQLNSNRNKKKYSSSLSKVNIVTKIEAGQFFGEEELLKNKPRGYTAIVASKFATVYYLSNEKMWKFLNENPMLVAFLRAKSNMKQAIHKSQEQNQRILAQLEHSQIEEQLKTRDRSIKQKEQGINGSPSRFQSKEREKVDNSTASLDPSQISVNYSAHSTLNHDSNDNNRSRSIVNGLNIDYILKSDKKRQNMLDIGNSKELKSASNSPATSIDPQIGSKITKRKGANHSVLRNKKLSNIKDELNSALNASVGDKKLEEISKMISINEKTLNQLEKNNSNDTDLMQSFIKPYKSTNSTPKKLTKQDDVSLPLLVANQIEKLTIKSHKKSKRYRSNIREINHFINVESYNLNNASVLAQNQYYTPKELNLEKYSSKAIISAITKPQNMNNTNMILATAKEALAQIERKILSPIIKKPRNIRSKLSIPTICINSKPISLIECSMEKVQNLPTRINMQFMSGDMQSMQYDPKKDIRKNGEYVQNNYTWSLIKKTK